MRLCPDFGNFPAKIVKTTGNLDLTHSLRFPRVGRARRVRDNYHTPGPPNTARERARPGPPGLPMPVTAGGSAIDPSPLNYIAW